MFFQRLRQIFLALLFTFIISFEYCCSHKPHQDIVLLVQDSAVYTSQNYSEFRIDSNLINQLLANDHSMDSFTDQIKEFYRRRNYQAAWYIDSSLTTQGHNFIVRLRNYMMAFSDSSILDWRLNFVADSVELKPALNYSFEQHLPVLDILLTSVFFKYAKHEYYGTDKHPHDLEWYIPRKKKNYLQLLDAIITSDESYAKFEPLSPYYKTLKIALIKYRKIEQAGGFPSIPEEGSGKTNEYSLLTITNLRRYLALTEDLSVSDTSTYFSESLQLALKSYQNRMGLPATAQLDKATIKSLNITVQQRIRQMMINMERLRWAPDNLADNYLLVNIPEFKLHVYEQGKFIWDMNIVVGKDATVTSIFADQLRSVVFCPYWNVPQSIIRKEFLPILKRDPGYLNRMNMEVLSNGKVINPYSISWSMYNKSVPFEIRQKPGKKNALGLILFMFPNQYNIYMHDTPAKGLFDENYRAYSHGCIRLAEAEKLANYIFRNDTSVTSEKIKNWMNLNKETRKAVNPSLPVYIGYFTAWVTQDGKLNFRNDIYGLDQKLSSEIFAN